MFNVKVRGLPELMAALANVSTQLRTKLLRSALREGARVVQKRARGAAPVLNPSSMPVRRGVRASGTLKKSIVVRSNKMARRAGIVGVSVAVMARKGAKLGSNRSSDPYYAPWVEFGHKIVGRFKGDYSSLPLRGRGRRTGIALRRQSPLGFVAARPFMRLGAAMLPEALRIITDNLESALRALNSVKR